MDGDPPTADGEGDPGQAADLLTALESVGLKGSKLAACAGQEVGLSKQLAEHLGIFPAAWHADFVKAQIQAAVDMEELELRASGAYASPSVQRLRDFMEVVQKEESPKHSAADEVIAIIPRKGAMAKTAKMRGGEEVPEGLVEERILATLMKELEAYNAPILAEIRAAMNPGRAAQALFGKYRATTVKRYLGYVQHLRNWMHKMDKMYGPVAGVDVVDYLYTREEEGIGYPIPITVYQALVWFEKVAAVPTHRRLADHDFLNMVVKDLTRRLEEKAPPVRRAPRWPGKFVEWMEFIVLDPSFTEAMRLTAWMKLLKFWGAMRFDDAANLRTGCLRYFEGKIQGIMQKTKTTGAGKRVRELPIYISEEAHIKDPRWIGAGFKLAKLGPKCERDLVFYDGMFYGKCPTNNAVKYQEMVAASSALFRSLKDSRGEPVFPDSWERFWTEHSERATLPSAMAAIEVQKVDRDLLGRWHPEGSDQYIRTYNTIIGRMQKRYAEVVREGNSHQVFDEGGIYEDLKVWMVTHWQVDAENAETAVNKWKENLRLSDYEKPRQSSGGHEGGRTPTEHVISSDEDIGGNLFGLPRDEAAPDVPVEPAVQRFKRRRGIEVPEGDQEMDMPSQPADRKKMERLDGDRVGGYVVVSRRTGRGTLHKLGLESCWMARTKGFRDSETYDACPEPELYSSRCKLCWPVKKTDDSEESTSDSEDDVDLAEDEEI